jgi:hypothetical protein
MYNTKVKDLCVSRDICLYSDSLWAGWSGDRMRGGGGGFSAPVQIGPGAHSVSYTMGTESFPVVKQQGSGVDRLPHLAPGLKKESNGISTTPVDIRGLF